MMIASTAVAARYVRQRCHFSTEPLVRPRIIMRQPRDKAKIKIGKAKAKSERPKEKETPWPKSVQIAGYAALAVTVPASMLTIVAEQPYVRDVMLGDRPHDETWAKVVVDFVRRYWSQDAGLFEGETERSVAEERELCKLMDCEVPLSVVGLVEDRNVGNVVHYFPATLVATAQSIWGQIYPDDKVSQMEGRFAVEFQDIVDKEEISQIVESHSDFDEFVGVDSSDDDDDIKLFRISQGSSGWQYIAPTLEPSMNSVKTSPIESKNNGMSSKEVRISELKYNEAQLQMQMIDPYCTREIDEMEKELAKIRQELRSLKGRWRKWFG